jgi:hypothetical protein
MEAELSSEMEVNFYRLHGVTLKKRVLFAVIDVRKSNPIYCHVSGFRD